MGPEEEKIMLIKPTVGRMVYYKSYGSPDNEIPSAIYPAVITAVKDADKGIVSLFVMYDNGTSNKVRVENGDLPNQWDWMPFQKDQQARLASK